MALISGRSPVDDMLVSSDGAQANGRLTQRFLLRVRAPLGPPALEYRVRVALGGRGALELSPVGEHYVLALPGNMILGDAIVALAGVGVDVLACSETPA